MSIRQPFDLRMHDRELVDVNAMAGRCVDFHGRYIRLAPVPPLQFHIRLNGDPVGYPMQPASQGVAGADRTGLSGQDKERGLKRVFDVVLVLQDGGQVAATIGP